MDRVKEKQVCAPFRTNARLPLNPTKCVSNIFPWRHQHPPSEHSNVAISSFDVRVHETNLIVVQEGAGREVATAAIFELAVAVGKVFADGVDLLLEANIEIFARHN